MTAIIRPSSAGSKSPVQTAKKRYSVPAGTATRSLTAHPIFSRHHPLLSHPIAENSISPLDQWYSVPAELKWTDLKTYYLAQARHSLRLGSGTSIYSDLAGKGSNPIPEIGSFVFQWPYSAHEVFVTGTFDNWGKTVQLEKKGGIFEKEVQLPHTDEKIYYRFFVDGSWATDRHAREENDGDNNVNNVLFPEDIIKKAPESDTDLESLDGEILDTTSIDGDSTTGALTDELSEESEEEESGDETAAISAPITPSVSQPSETEPAADTTEHREEISDTRPEAPSEENKQLPEDSIIASDVSITAAETEPDTPTPDLRTFSADAIAAEFTVESKSEDNGESNDTAEEESYEGDISHAAASGLESTAMKLAEVLSEPTAPQDVTSERNASENVHTCETSLKNLMIESVTPTSELAAEVPLEFQRGEASSEVPSTEASTEASTETSTETSAEALSAKVLSGEAPSEVPSAEALSTEAPSAELLSGETLSTEAPSTEELSTEAPFAEALSTEAPSVELLSGETLSTEASFEVPSAEVLPIEALSTEALSAKALSGEPPSEASSVEALSAESSPIDLPSVETPSAEVFDVAEEQYTSQAHENPEDFAEMETSEEAKMVEEEPQKQTEPNESAAVETTSEVLEVIEEEEEVEEEETKVKEEVEVEKEIEAKEEVEGEEKVENKEEIEETKGIETKEEVEAKEEVEKKEEKEEKEETEAREEIEDKKEVEANELKAKEVGTQEKVEAKEEPEEKEKIEAKEEVQAKEKVENQLQQEAPLEPPAQTATAETKITETAPAVTAAEPVDIPRPAATSVGEVQMPYVTPKKEESPKISLPLTPSQSTAATGIREAQTSEELTLQKTESANVPLPTTPTSLSQQTVVTGVKETPTSNSSVPEKARSLPPRTPPKEHSHHRPWTSHKQRSTSPSASIGHGGEKEKKRGHRHSGFFKKLRDKLH